jgi:hypothetical protein
MIFLIPTEMSRRARGRSFGATGHVVGTIAVIVLTPDTLG